MVLIWNFRQYYCNLYSTSILERIALKIHAWSLLQCQSNQFLVFLCFGPSVSVYSFTRWLISCRIELASFAYSSSYASSRRYRANESCPSSLLKDSGSNTSVPGYLFASFRILLSVLSEARSFSTSNTVTRCETASSMLLTRVHDMG